MRWPLGAGMLRVPKPKLRFKVVLLWLAFKWVRIVERLPRRV
jgi:hypothetical protein